MLPDEIPIRFTLRPKHLLLSPLGVLLVIGAYHLPWDAPSAPAWVQAVGSVAAIVAAFWISSWQQRQAAIDRQRQNYRYMFKAFQVASNAVATVTSVVEDIKVGRLSPSNLSYYDAILANSESQLEAFSFRDMVDFEYGSLWIDITKHVSLVKCRIMDHAETPDLIPRAMNLDLILDVVPKQLNGLQQLLELHSVRVGPEVYQDHHL